MDFGFLEESTLKVPFRNTSPPLLALNSSPLKAREFPSASGFSLPPDSLEIAFQFPCSLSLSFLSASVSARRSSASGTLNHESRSSNQFSTMPLPGVAPSCKKDNRPVALSVPFRGVYQRNCCQQPGLPEGNTMYTPFLPVSKPL